MNKLPKLKIDFHAVTRNCKNTLESNLSRLVYDQLLYSIMVGNDATEGWALHINRTLPGRRGYA